MGYTTEFQGQFYFDRKLDDDTYNLLVGLASTRRMKRQGLDPKYGVDGEFYFNPESNDSGQERDDSIVNYNSPPSTQPSLWLQWIPTNDRRHLEWDGGEKFYYYVEWLEYLIKKILAPRGYLLNGSVTWQGEDSKDMGTIKVSNNFVASSSWERELEGLQMELKDAHDALNILVKEVIDLEKSSHLLTIDNHRVRSIAQKLLEERKAK